MASRPVVTEEMKQLRIKSGAVKRLLKEYQYYLKEEAEQREKIQKMKEKKEVEHEVRKQMECLEDTLRVLPETLGQLQKYKKELSSLLEERFFTNLAVAANNEDLEKQSDAEKQILEAQKLLKEVEKQINDNGTQQCVKANQKEEETPPILGAALGGEGKAAENAEEMRQKRLARFGLGGQ